MLNKRYVITQRKTIQMVHWNYKHFLIVYSQAVNLDITEPLYYKVLSITYDIIHPNNSEINGTEPWYNETLL